ncbi:MAG TPA: hypothetical protein VE422_30150 [Terriglobia bacterium]|nr:hypothetical protein [Terriglobia bacterium]
MVWSFIRVAIFTVAFVVGMMIAWPESDVSADSSSDSQIAQLDKNAGSSLVVACDGGKVIITPLPNQRDAVQLDCLRSRMVVAGDYRPMTEKIPERRFMPMDLVVSPPQ